MGIKVGVTCAVKQLKESGLAGFRKFAISLLERYVTLFLKI